jgi:hypothetical protein
MKRTFFAPLLSTALLLAMFPASGAPIVLDGALTQQRVAGLTSEIQWQTSLGQAMVTARHENKMIFWVHMLGDMKGAT